MTLKKNRIRGILVTVICSFSFIISASSCNAQPLSQKKSFTRQDTLRGSITPERAWWDVTHYAIEVIPDFNSKSLQGSNRISFLATSSGNKMQIDLQQPMKITSVEHSGKQLEFTRDGNVYFVTFNSIISAGTKGVLNISFSGTPVEAKNAPWDGGWIWKKDRNGHPWMSVACQGLGASVWYPCKDHQGDEVDSATLAITVPHDLVGVGNGRLRTKSSTNGKSTYTWAVVSPINNYNIVPSIGRYANWDETFDGESGKLDCSYWVLDYNLEKARKHFQQVPVMLKAFEHWFGPFPFYADSYKLVESPHLGMEHQSAVAYGNRYMNGYLGRDLSGSGWGEKWDFIIIHESGHEWFANNITTKDIADMWVHEGFTSYSETIYTTYHYGVEAGNAYCIGLRKNIKNDIPVIGHYGVNQEGSGDMYYKGSNMLHTIRQIVNDDEKFRSIMRGLNKAFYHKTVSSGEVENYISQQSGKDFGKVFDQFLRTNQIPKLEYSIKNSVMEYRWIDCVPDFDMPVKIKTDKEIWLKPVTQWKQMDLKGSTDIIIDPNFYIQTKKL